MNGVNQLKDKVVSMMEEISKWSQTQRTVDGMMRNIYNEMNSFAANFKNSIHGQPSQWKYKEFFKSFKKSGPSKTKKMVT
jgi:hypothetical protein